MCAPAYRDAVLRGLSPTSDQFSSQLYKLVRKFPEMKKDVATVMVIEITGDSGWTIDMKHAGAGVGPVSTVEAR